MEKMNKARMTFVVGEYLAPTVFLLTMVILLCAKKIHKSFILMIVGFALGSIWEWAHYCIPNFIKVKDDIDKHIPGPVYCVLHSLHDSMLFVLGYALCYFILNGKPFNNMDNSIASLLILFTFFVSVEIIVEIVFNLRIWTYKTDERNPSLMEFETNIMNVKRQHVVNVWPVFEWIIATFVFWIFCIYIK